MFKVGQKFEISRIITEQDVYAFAGVTGDCNRIHIDRQYAEKTHFKKRIVHGALIISIISAVLGNKFPGDGTIYISQESYFKKPVYIDDELFFKFEIIDINEKNRARIITNVYNMGNELVFEGVAYVLLP